MTQDDRSKDMQGMIDANLKRVYDSIAGEEIPDRFADLLEKLKQQDQSRTDAKNGDQAG